MPQISVIAGLAAGGGCYSPALTDFVVMTEDAAMFLTGPAVVRDVAGEEVGMQELGGRWVHERNGVCDFVAPERALRRGPGRRAARLPAAARRRRAAAGRGRRAAD